MAYIDVDYSRFDHVIDRTNAYVSTMKNKMSVAGDEVRYLSSSWHGDDSSSFQTQWQTVTDDSSVYRNMIKALEQYSDTLKYAKKSYQKAQMKVIDKSNTLRW